MKPRRGFTLLETAIVLAITAIGALLVLPQWPSALASPFADDVPGAALVRELVDARHQAIAARQLVTVRLDAAQQRLRIDTSGSSGRGIWRETALPLAGEESLVTSDTAEVLVFRPSGAAQGRALMLRHAQGWLSITLDPWSGEVIRVAR